MNLLDFFFQVERIHIFLERDTDLYDITALNLTENWKMNFHFLGRRMSYRDAFQYASNNLLRRNVMIMNADCYVDRGFERLDESILNNKIMYALTRHETPENVRLCNARDMLWTDINIPGFPRCIFIQASRATSLSTIREH